MGSVGRVREFSSLLIFVLAAVGAVAAHPELAELEQRVLVAPASERAEWLVKLAERAEPVDPARARAAAEEAERVAVTPHDRLAAQAIRASLLRQQTNYQGALALAREGLEQATQLKDDAVRARFLYVIARTCWSLADYPKALENFHQTIHLGERLNAIALLADAHTGTVTIYTELRDHAQARMHIDAARGYVERLGDPRRTGDFYRVLGNHLGNLNDNAGARAAHERSRQVNAGAGNDRGVADALQNIGFIDETEGRLEEARRKFVEAVAIYERLGLKRHLANAYRQLGRVLGKQKHLPEALDYLERSLALAREFGGGVAVSNAYRQLAIAHEAAGNLAVALEYQRKLDQANETIFGEKSRQQIAVLDARYDAERRKHEVEMLKRDQALREAELARVRSERYALLAVVALAAVALGALVSRHRLKLASERRVLEETRAAKDAAERADAFKTKLVGIASHDLKAPVAALIGAAESLQRDAGDPAAVATMARLMVGEGRRMLTLIRDLLDLAALETGRIELDRSPVAIASVARDCVETLEVSARAKQQELICTVEPEAERVCVSADPERLRQVLTNLLDNAIKFTPPGRPVRVGVASDGGMVRVAVQDAGPGLTPEDYVRVFQPFQKLSARPTGGESSTGLGLSIAREIVSLHGGQMVVESTPGEGATFGFVLPMALA